MWEQTEAPGGNSRGHRENVRTDRIEPAYWDRQNTTSSLWVIVLREKADFPTEAHCNRTVTLSFPSLFLSGTIKYANELGHFPVPSSEKVEGF